MSLEDKVILLVDSHHGVYIPQLFCKNFVKNCLQYESNYNELKECFQDCLDSESENYIDSWEKILDQLWYVFEGVKYTLYQYEDLWAIPDNLTEEEQEELENWN